jgi:adenylyl-sulfate kinase
MESRNVKVQNFQVSRNDRATLIGQNSKIIWFTGLSGSGKSTLSNALASKLHQNGFLTYNLDGDNIRMGLNGDLQFSIEDRKENIRRIGEVAKLFWDSGVIVLTSFISPLISDRERVRELVPQGDFIEVFVDCPLEVCESRDVKGLYQKARKGLIKDFTGISSPFEAPQSPEITINTEKLNLEEAVESLFVQILPKVTLSK